MDSMDNQQQIDSRMSKKRVRPGTQDAEMDDGDQSVQDNAGSAQIKERKKIKVKRKMQ